MLLTSSTAGVIERYSHLFLSLENQADRPGVAKLPFDEDQELLEFFGMNHNPFDLDTGLSDCIAPGHKKAQCMLRQGIDEDIPLSLLTARNGMNRGAVIHSLTKKLCFEAYCVVVLTLEESQSEAAFLANLLYELGAEDVHRKNYSCGELMERLKLVITERCEQDKKRRFVLVLSEAQNMDRSIVPYVHWLTSLAVGERRVATVVLVGEPGLRQTLRTSDFSGLSHRLYLAATLEPLTLDETDAYLKACIRKAGLQGRLFAPEACEFIYRASGGICREIDTLAFNGLVAGYRLGMKSITSEIQNYFR